MTNTLESLSLADLATAVGGMRYGANDRESTNVEDRRTPEGKAANQQWYERNKGDYGKSGPTHLNPNFQMPKQTFPGGPR